MRNCILIVKLWRWQIPEISKCGLKCTKFKLTWKDVKIYRTICPCHAHFQISCQLRDTGISYIPIYRDLMERKSRWHSGKYYFYKQHSFFSTTAKSKRMEVWRMILCFKFIIFQCRTLCLSWRIDLFYYKVNLRK